MIADYKTLAAYTTVLYRRGQWLSVVPGDCPAGGRHYAPATRAGLDYVTRGYSYSHARRVFNGTVGHYRC